MDSTSLGRGGLHVGRGKHEGGSGVGQGQGTVDQDGYAADLARLSDYRSMEGRHPNEGLLVLKIIPHFIHTKERKVGGTRSETRCVSYSKLRKELCGARVFIAECLLARRVLALSAT